jgi:hypothetical protein
MTDPLARLAARAEADPFFLAAPLAVFAQTEGLDDAGLAAKLGLPPERLPKLKLCRPPRPEPEHFTADVRQIAGHFGIDPDALAHAVRRGQTVIELRSGQPAPADGTGAFLVARDADPPPGDSP